MSWSVSTTPIEVENAKPTATITIDSTKADKEKLKKLEAKLWGSENEEPTLPLPSEIVSMMGEISK